jgi:hypothetical protein
MGRFGIAAWQLSLLGGGLPGRASPCAFVEIDDFSVTGRPKS